mmetsp:Transcript_17739/g.30036  ORF Transcript_17739/g.30036 Transcript_17739/m.30036 type:complete len:126 (-) Transcript_17739:87-464(-)|eukprot:CAMPEP_0168621220 /NCGR_PEP_ID=MMETSP0449_2-20121227/7569_1 /TAXON_ID=1082188 /ORGANISM="Strombidium rassoulzadegani, Strain ras09" /LENGTH=125 /DNA_ID=CAMNT_0008662307 /DNA_START=403 /DNA_END=780 /DNA_ORIENTATION=-
MEERKSAPPLDVLIQVLLNNSEGTKHGVSREEAKALATHIQTDCPMLRFRGLMSMGEIGDVDEFRAMHTLKQEMLPSFEGVLSEEDFVLSMGTSQDYELAIKEGGANQVRLGTTIFGARDYSKKK